MPDTDLDALFNDVAAEQSGSVDEIVEDSSAVVDEPDYSESTDDVDDLGEYDDADNSDDGAGEETSYNWEEYADMQIPFKVAGEEGVVTLRELRDGYMRNQDYTRKTQDAAELKRAAQWAQDVQAAFQRDPMGTLEAFANAYGLLEGNTQQVSSQRQTSIDELDDDIRPWAEQAMKANEAAQRMEQRLVELENERIKSEIRSQIEVLKNQFGEDFDPVETLQVAASKNLTLEDAHWYLLGQRNMKLRTQSDEASRAAESAAVKQRQVAESQRVQKKRSATSSTKNSFRASDIPVDDFNDIGELFERIAANS